MCATVHDRASFPAQYSPEAGPKDHLDALDALGETDTLGPISPLVLWQPRLPHHLVRPPHANNNHSFSHSPPPPPANRGLRWALGRPLSCPFLQSRPPSSPAAAKSSCMGNDGYTESSVLALALLMAEKTLLPFPRHIWNSRWRAGRSFFVHQERPETFSSASSSKYRSRGREGKGSVRQRAGGTRRKWGMEAPLFGALEHNRLLARCHHQGNLFGERKTLFFLDPDAVSQRDPAS